MIHVNTSKIHKGFWISTSLTDWGLFISVYHTSTDQPPTATAGSKAQGNHHDQFHCAEAVRVANEAIHCSVVGEHAEIHWQADKHTKKKKGFQVSTWKVLPVLEQQILNQKDTGYATSVSGSLLDILLVSREVFRESTPWCLIKNLVKKFKRHPKHSILGFKSVSHEGRTCGKTPNRLQKGTLFGSNLEANKATQPKAIGQAWDTHFFGASKECALSLASSSSL